MMASSPSNDANLCHTGRTGARYPDNDTARSEHDRYTSATTNSCERRRCRYEFRARNFLDQDRWQRAGLRERLLHRPGRAFLHVGQHRLVDAERDPHASVTEHLRHHLDRDASTQQQGGARVPQVVHPGRGR